MAQDYIIGPVKRVSNFNPDEIRDWLCRGGAGVVIRETPPSESLEAIQRFTPVQRGQLSKVYIRYSNEPKGEESQSLYRSTFPDPLTPQSLTDLMDLDARRLHAVRPCVSRLAMVLKDSFKTRMHVDSGAAENYYLHRNLGATGTGMWLVSAHERCPVPPVLDDRGNTLSFSAIEKMIQQGQAEAFQIGPGESVIFNGEMAHISTPPQKGKFRYLIT